MWGKKQQNVDVDAAYENEHNNNMENKQDTSTVEYHPKFFISFFVI